VLLAILAIAQPIGDRILILWGAEVKPLCGAAPPHPLIKLLQFSNEYNTLVCRASRGTQANLGLMACRTYVKTAILRGSAGKALLGFANAQVKKFSLLR
jgi:hypothetical protein